MIASVFGWIGLAGVLMLVAAIAGVGWAFWRAVRQLGDLDEAP